jgi:hypothetical protein
MARTVQVLEIENHRLKETNRYLRDQLAGHTAVPDLTRRRRNLTPHNEERWDRAGAIAPLPISGNLAGR